MVPMKLDYSLHIGLQRYFKDRSMARGGGSIGASACYILIRSIPSAHLKS